MKFRTYGMVLSLFFALVLVFSFSIEASGSHDGPNSGITADEVNPTVKGDVQNFLTHIVEYYNGIRDQFDPVADRAELVRELTIFARDIRREGDYKHGNFYTIGITDNNVVTNHAGHPELIGHTFDPNAANSAIASTLKALLDKAASSGIGGTPECEENYDGQGSVACAAKVKSDYTVDVTNIAGLIHDATDPAFVPPDCEDLELATTAAEVETDETKLEDYVKSVIDAVQKDVAKINVDTTIEVAGGNDIASLATLRDPAKQKEITDRVTTKIQERLFCFGSGKFKHGSIYPFIMGADLDNSTVLVNGNSFDLNGYDLNLVDNQLQGEQNIAKLFNNELGGNPMAGDYATVEYHWLKPGDQPDPPDWFEQEVVPGKSPKTSYIEVADLNGMVIDALVRATGVPASLLIANSPDLETPQLYIFGSGIYPEEGMMPGEMMGEGGDGGGCTITGAGHKSQSALLNLLLVASVLFSVVFLRKRA